MIQYRPKFSPRSCYLLRDPEEVAYFTSRGGAPEAPLIEWASGLIGRGEVFVDVGAHVGSWTQHLVQKCRHVIAFEPQAITHARLRAGLELANLIDRVTPIHAALGRVGGVARMHIVSLDGGGTTTVFRRELGELLGVEDATMIRFDDLAIGTRHGRIGLVKLDVEGGEHDALIGSEATLEAHLWPDILAEAWLHPWYARERTELKTYLSYLGYTVRDAPEWPEMVWAHR